MTDDSLRETVRTIRERLQEQLDVEFASLVSSHEQAVAAARVETELAAEQRWSAVLADASSQAQRDVEAAVRAARVETELASDQHWSVVLADARSQVQHDVEAAVTAARAEFDLERTNALRRQASLAQLQRALDQTSSLTEALAVMLHAVGEQVSSAAVFVLRGDELDGWAATGDVSADVLKHQEPVVSLLREAVERRRPVSRNGACAVPLLLDGKPVGVLSGSTAAGETSAPTDLLELIARAGAARLAYLTAIRTVEAQRWLSLPAAPQPIHDLTSPRAAMP